MAPAVGVATGVTESRAEPPSPERAHLALDAGESEALLGELGALAGTLRDPGARARWVELSQAAESGEIPPQQLADLEQALALSLETGRARRMQGADGEQALLRLWGRTPQGEAVRRAVQEANHALEGLRGQALAKLAFSPQGPGGFRLEIATDLCKVTLEIGRKGVTVDSVEV